MALSLVFDLAYGLTVEVLGYKTGLFQVGTVMRGPQPLSVQVANAGSPAVLPTGKRLWYGIKLPSAIKGDWLVLCELTQPAGSLPTAPYTGTLQLNNDAVRTAMHASLSDPAPELTALPCLAEIYYTDADGVSNAVPGQNFTITIGGPLVNGTEGIAPSPNVVGPTVAQIPINLAAVTQRTSSSRTDATALANVVTVGRAPGQLFCFTEASTGNLVFFRLVAGAATADNADQVAPADYDAGTNPVHFALVPTAIAAGDDPRIVNASRDYLDDNYQAFASRVAGKTAGTSTVNLFSAGDFTAGTGFVWNPTRWCADIDLTCFSPWNSTEHEYQGGCLITPRHVQLAAHFSDPALTSVGAATVTNGGSGYTSAPLVTVVGTGHGGGIAATISGGSVTALTVYGGGYYPDGGTNPLTLAFSGGGGSGATATVTRASYGSNPMTPGATVIKFVGADNTVYARTITALARVGESDVLIGTLDSDLPAAIRPAKLLPTNVGSFVGLSVPALTTNKDKQAHINSAYVDFIPAGVGSGYYLSAFTNGPFAPWSINPPAGGGSSGSPVFFVLDGAVCLHCLFHYANVGDSAAQQLAGINAILGSAYALTVTDFTSTRDPGAARVNEDAYFDNLSFQTLSLRNITDGPRVVMTDEDGNALASDFSVFVTDNTGFGFLVPLAAGQSVRRKADGTGFEAYTPGGGSVSNLDVYADSVGGNDRYNGLSAAAPVRTLAAAQRLALAHGAGVKVGLVSGSYWRETLDLGGLSNVTVQSVGSGTLPVIDGADVVTAWAKTAGRTSVYQAVVTHNLSNDTTAARLTVYENGALLRRVADQATCDATAGSFVDARADAGSPLTVYVHATGDGNPAGNGRLYEVTTRLYAFSGGPGCALSGVQTMRAISNDGSLELAAQTGVTITGALALNGTKHNCVFGSGTVRDSIALFDDPPTSYQPSNVAWTAYLPDPTVQGGQSILFERVGTVGIAGGDFLAHGDGSGQYTSAIVRQCWTLGTPFNTVPDAATARLSQGSYYGAGIVAAPSAGTFDQVLVYLNSTSGLSQIYGIAYQHVVCYTEPRYPTANYLAVFQNSSGYTFDHVAFAGAVTFDTLFANQNSASSGAMTSTHTVYFGGIYHAWIPPGVTYTGDYNVFMCTHPDHPQILSVYHGTYYGTLADWQTATGQDAHSVYLAAVDQTAGNAGAFWLAWKNAAAGTDLSTVGPKAGDWRVNPTAVVYSADGVAHIGAFPDGTAITTAGPQTHWDWNARAFAAGAPAAWPNVPATAADAQAYVAQPQGWVF